MARHAQNMTDPGAEPRSDGPATEPADGGEVVPTFSEQLAQQLGGVRGVIESGIPVAVFVIVNIIAGLKPALIVAIASALVVAVFRLIRRQTVRHALNGLFGVGIGGYLAWHTGSAKAFYLPGIIISFAYGVVMLASVLVRRPLVGWIWSLLVAGGSMAWRDQPSMVRLFSRLTVLWSVTYLAKVAIQTWLYQTMDATVLGVARLVLGYPPYALLLALTVWAVRRHNADPALAEAR